MSWVTDAPERDNATGCGGLLFFVLLFVAYSGGNLLLSFVGYFSFVFVGVPLIVLTGLALIARAAGFGNEISSDVPGVESTLNPADTAGDD